ncbi:MAG: ATP-dependent Clp protease ATP-binding subunit [Herpetosiphonaceae bacterium]|nr:ATP-dependent Clp protease ATP-binding subunit [Herpetosiphonaceae bacterium]
MSNASQQPIPVDELPAGLQCAVRGNANPLDAIEADLRAAVYGQDRAIESVVRALNRAKFGFAAGSHDRPLVNLMFLGPTGVGKSECAKRLAARLHPDGGGFLKIDCSLFSQGHEVSALVGAPPSYVGRDQKPLLDPEMIESENSIVLFDEIEKGTPELWNLLLQIMEDGAVTLLNSGRSISFRKTILIMTTNVGAQEMIDFLDQRNIGFRSSRSDVEATGQHIYHIGFEALQRVFSPEWINRIDEIIAFRPLSSTTMSKIFDRMINEANAQYVLHGIQLNVTPSAKEHILRRGYNPRFGARPLRARLLKDVDAPLADLLASGGVPEGSEVTVAYTGGAINQELSFFFQHNAAIEMEGRIQRELARTAPRERAVNEEPQPSPAGPFPNQGPSMARTIDGWPRR